MPKNQLEADPQKPDGGRTPKTKWRQIPKNQVEAGPQNPAGGRTQMKPLYNSWIKCELLWLTILWKLPINHRAAGEDELLGGHQSIMKPLLIFPGLTKGRSMAVMLDSSRSIKHSLFWFPAALECSATTWPQSWVCSHLLDQSTDKQGQFLLKMLMWYFK